MDTFEKYFAIVGLVITTALGDYYSKCYSQSPALGSAAAAMSSYLVSLAFWFALLRGTQNLARAGLIWGVSATAGVLVISQLFFQECLTWRQWTGVGFGIVSLTLLLV
jgi:multidrug transporter EmrE-like cation transporter